MTTRGKSLNASSLNRIRYEEEQIARLRAVIAAGKGNKRSQGALDKKLSLVESIKAKMEAREAKAANKAVAIVTLTAEGEEVSVVSNDTESLLEAALTGAEAVTVDSLEAAEDVAV